MVYGMGVGSNEATDERKTNMTDRAKQLLALEANHRDNTPRDTTLAEVAAEVAIKAAAEYLRVSEPGQLTGSNKLNQCVRRGSVVLRLLAPVTGQTAQKARTKNQTKI